MKENILDLVTGFLMLALSVRMGLFNYRRLELHEGLLITPVLLLLAIFFVVSGITHALEPGIEAIIRSWALPLVLIANLIWLIFASGRIMRLPSILDLEAKNRDLEREIQLRTAAEERLKSANDSLEQRIAERAAEVQGIIEASPLAIMRLNDKKEVTLWNPAAERLFGWSANEILGKPNPVVPTEKLPEFQNLFHATVSGRRLAATETQRRRKDGTLVDVRIWNAPLPVSDPNSGSAMAMFDDITETRKIRDQLNEAKIKAEHASQTKSLFLANVGHEIRTPLNAIVGFADLLKSGNCDRASEQFYLGSMIKNGLLLSQLINDLLDVSKIEAGELEISIEPVNVQDILNDVFETQALKAREKSLKMDFRKSLTVADPLVVLTDPLRLRQILINLISNAVKFTDSGGIEVTCAYSGESLLIKIKDTGKGLSKAEISNLFSPFSQADASITKKYGGTGLGLYLSKNLAGRLKGDLFLESSAPGRGSTFVLKLNAPVFQGALPRDHQPVAAPLHPLEGKKILIVDDSEENRILVSKYVVAEGAEVAEAKDGEEGVTKTLEFSPDVVLMDLQMPRKDGYQALRDLRGMGQKVPAVAMTAYSMREDREKCLREGFNGHVSKPITRTKLVSEIMTLVKNANH